MEKKKVNTQHPPHISKTSLPQNQNFAQERSHFSSCPPMMDTGPDGQWNIIPEKASDSFSGSTDLLVNPETLLVSRAARAPSCVTDWFDDLFFQRVVRSTLDDGIPMETLTIGYRAKEFIAKENLLEMAKDIASMANTFQTCYLFFGILKKDLQTNHSSDESVYFANDPPPYPECLVGIDGNERSLEDCFDTNGMLLDSVGKQLQSVLSMLPHISYAGVHYEHKYFSCLRVRATGEAEIYYGLDLTTRPEVTGPYQRTCERPVSPGKHCDIASEKLKEWRILQQVMIPRPAASGPVVWMKLPGESNLDLSGFAHCVFDFDGTHGSVPEGYHLCQVTPHMSLRDIEAVLSWPGLHSISVDHKVWVTGLSGPFIFRSVLHVMKRAAIWTQLFRPRGHPMPMPLWLAYVHDGVPLFLWEWMNRLRNLCSYSRACLIIDSSWESTYRDYLNLDRLGLLDGQLPDSSGTVNITDALCRWWEDDNVTILSVAPSLWIPKFNTVRSPLKLDGVIVMRGSHQPEPCDECNYLMGGGWSPNVAKADVMERDQNELHSMAERFLHTPEGSIFLIEHEAGIGGSSFGGSLAWFLLTNPSLYGVEALYYIDGRSTPPQEMDAILAEFKSHQIPGSTIFLDNATSALLQMWARSDILKGKHPLFAVARRRERSREIPCELLSVPIPQAKHFLSISDHYRRRLEGVRSSWSQEESDAIQSTHYRLSLQLSLDSLFLCSFTCFTKEYEPGPYIIKVIETHRSSRLVLVVALCGGYFPFPAVRPTYAASLQQEMKAGDHCLLFLCQRNGHPWGIRFRHSFLAEIYLKGLKASVPILTTFIASVVEELFCNIHPEFCHLLKNTASLRPPTLVANTLKLSDHAAFLRIIDKLEYALTKQETENTELGLYLAKVRLIYFKQTSDYRILEQAISILDRLEPTLKRQTLLASVLFAQARRRTFLSSDQALSAMREISKLLEPLTHRGYRSHWAVGSFFKYISSLILLQPEVVERDISVILEAAVSCQEIMSFETPLDKGAGLEGLVRFSRQLTFPAIVKLTLPSLIRSLCHYGGFQVPALPTYDYLIPGWSEYYRLASQVTPEIPPRWCLSDPTYSKHILVRLITGKSIQEPQTFERAMPRTMAMWVAVRVPLCSVVGEKYQLMLLADWYHGDLPLLVFQREDAMKTCVWKFSNGQLVPHPITLESPAKIK